MNPEITKLLKLRYNKESDPLVVAATSAQGLLTIGNQDFMDLYLLILGPSPQQEVRRALCDWRGVPKDRYPAYFKTNWQEDVQTQEGVPARYFRQSQNKHFAVLPGRPICITLSDYGLANALKVAARVGIKVETAR